MRTTKKALREMLMKLPKERNKLARRLEYLECKGAPKCLDNCPIANYVANQLGDNEAIEIDESFATIWNVLGCTCLVTVKIPLHVKNFITAFDAGAYPYLRLT
jgi:hypothetical protein